MEGKWIEVYSTFDSSEATIVQGLLESEGIPCRVESTGVSQIPVAVGNLGEILLFVHPDDFDKAKKAMDAARKESPEDIS